MIFVLVIAIEFTSPRRRAAAPCGHRYARGEVSEAAFTNEADSVYTAYLVEYR